MRSATEREQAQLPSDATEWDPNSSQAKLQHVCVTGLDSSYAMYLSSRTRNCLPVHRCRGKLRSGDSEEKVTASDGSGDNVALIA